MGKTLVLITSQFPFGTGEPFLETEFPYLQKEFGKIFIIAQNSNLKKTRNVSSNVRIYRYKTTTTFFGYLYLPILLISNLRLILNLYRQENNYRKNSNYALHFNNKLFLLKKIIKALQLKSFISKILAINDIRRDIIFYSYWLNTGAHAISLLSFPGSIKISRAHGSDLYEEKSPLGYLPLLKTTSEKLDGIFLISDNGRNYYINKTGTSSSKCIISKLGVKGEENLKLKHLDSNLFRIASCSNLIPLKRIDLIINALEKTKSMTLIKWIHFGDGLLKGDLLKLAEKKLIAEIGITYEFAGYIPNNEILAFYRNNQIDLFLNTSSTEGVPVSIMEAQSNGIPVMATDVGGVRELVTEGSGILLSPNITADELSDAINNFINLPYEIRRSFGVKSFESWKSNYNASKNYPEFLQMVNSILAAKTRVTD